MRGGLLVIPIGTGLLYAEPIYLQAERSPMPELRLVVLALQDRLAYGTTFEAALAGLFGASFAARRIRAGRRARRRLRRRPDTQPAADLTSLIRDAARDLSEYQRLTAEGKLGEAGQRLEALKQKLEQLQRERR